MPPTLSQELQQALSGVTFRRTRDSIGNTVQRVVGRQGGTGATGASQELDRGLQGSRARCRWCRPWQSASEPSRRAALAGVLAVGRLGGNLQRLDDQALGASASVRQLRSNQRALLTTTGSLSDASEKAVTILESYDRVARSVRSPEFGIEGLRNFQLGIGRLGISLDDFLGTRGDVAQLARLFDGINLDVTTEEGLRNLDKVRQTLGEVAAVELAQQVQFRRDFPEQARLIERLAGSYGQLTDEQTANLRVAQSAITAISASISGTFQQALAEFAPAIIDIAERIDRINLGRVFEVGITGAQRLVTLMEAMVAFAERLNIIETPTRPSGRDELESDASAAEAAIRATRPGRSTLGRIADAFRSLNFLNPAAGAGFDFGPNRAGGVIGSRVPGNVTNNFDLRGNQDPEAVADAVERRLNDQARTQFGLPSAGNPT